MQPTLRSQSGDATRDRYPALSLGFSNQGAALRYPHRLAVGFAQNNSSQQFGNANDCHDESGRFCEGGSSGGGALGRAARDHERMRRDDEQAAAYRAAGLTSTPGPQRREAYRNYSDKKWLKNTPPGEREAIDYDRAQLGKEPIDWKAIDAPPAKGTGGIGPQASIYSAEKRGKEYGYAKKVSFYQCTSVDQANEINAQLAELSDESGLVLDRVYVYKEKGSKEAPKNSNAYHQPSTNTIGFKNGVTAEYCAKNCPYPIGQQEANAKWFFDYADKMEHEHETGLREKADPEIVRAFRKQGEEALRFKDYKAHTVPGNGVRNPVVDHEFAHALVDRAYQTGAGKSVNLRVGDRIEVFGKTCQDFAKQEKFSVYAVTGRTYGTITTGEAISETYAYWKSGQPVPDHIAKGLRRLETYRGPGTGT